MYTQNGWAVGNPVAISKLLALEEGVEAASAAPLVVLGGDPNAVINNTALVTGATFASCHRGTRLFTVTATHALAEDCRLEGMVCSAGGGTVTVGLYDLTNNPNASPLATITSASNDAGSYKKSSVFTWPGAGAVLGIKVTVSGSAVEGAAWMLVIARED